MWSRANACIGLWNKQNNPVVTKLDLTNPHMKGGIPKPRMTMPCFSFEWPGIQNE